MFNLSERRWRGSLITRYKYHCGEKNTRSLISRTKACQAKRLSALSQTNTNKKPRHGDSHFPVPCWLSWGKWAGGFISGGTPGGEGSHQCKQLEDSSSCSLTVGAAAPERAPSCPPSKGAYTSVERERDANRSYLLA